jgi:hypothetical protein
MNMQLARRTGLHPPICPRNRQTLEDLGVRANERASADTVSLETSLPMEAWKAGAIHRPYPIDIRQTLLFQIDGILSDLIECRNGASVRLIAAFSQY